MLSGDDQGDALTGGRSAEAFTLPFAARIFVEPGTDPATVARLLRKAAAWVERWPQLVARCDPFDPLYRSDGPRP